MIKWPFEERRLNKRRSVDWNAFLRCGPPGGGQTAPTRVTEISLGGARMDLERLQFGSYHLVIGAECADWEIVFTLPEGQVKASFEVAWFNFDENKRLFHVGLSFRYLDEESRATLGRALKNLR